MGISDVGLKQDLVSRLVKEYKRREELSNGGHLAGGGSSNDKLEEESWEAKGSEFNEWCKAGLLMDKALNTGDVDYLFLARQVALERAYVIRVADEDSWSMAAKMVANNTIDPMSQLFGGNRERARLAAQNFSKNKRPKLAQERGQKVDAQQGYMFSLFLNLQQGQPFASVGFQTQPSCFPSWQQWLNQQELVSTAPEMGVSNMNPFMAGQHAVQSVFSHFQLRHREISIHLYWELGIRE
ncbi:14565_t:CDS:2 [Cetraspora pellucida]|uniref:14565_t:CDS:1 n=1 Tax=Cetraspora pellucida TaxID=1433469 RepID=A0A9N9D086_9GLOM|nr:14565_t:CDS:2 [Cetraspora pellucida]